jgi:hypothetical protein
LGMQAPAVGQLLLKCLQTDHRQYGHSILIAFALAYGDLLFWNIDILDT